MADSYYGFSITNSGTSSSTAYYYVSIASPAVYDGATVSLYPTSAQPSYFNYRSNSVQWQSPAARVVAGATVVTSQSSIEGVLGVSPAINVDLTLVCQGAAGTLGSVTLKAGETEIPFEFTVSSSDALTAEGGSEFLAKTAPRPAE